MSVETEKMAVHAAAEAFVDRIVEKVETIDQATKSQSDLIEETLGNLDVVGNPEYQGVIRRTIFQGFVAGTNLAGREYSGNFPPPPNLGTNDNIYVHFKTPMKVNRDSHMFWFHFSGYAFGSGKLVDEIFVGYAYAPQNALINQVSVGQLSPYSYVDANRNVILRLTLSSIYYLTLRVDTMRVGDGPLFDNDCFEVQYSTAGSVTFP